MDLSFGEIGFSARHRSAFPAAAIRILQGAAARSGSRLKGGMIEASRTSLMSTRALFAPSCCISRVYVAKRSTDDGLVHGSPHGSSWRGCRTSTPPPHISCLVSGATHDARLPRCEARRSICLARLPPVTHGCRARSRMPRNP